MATYKERIRQGMEIRSEAEDKKYWWHMIQIF